jgi:molecular chaperone GrpE (heat shock protein)
MIHVRRIAVNLASDAIEDIYYAELDDPIEGLNAVEIQDLIDHIKDRYCHIDQSDLDANLDKFNEGIDPSVPLIAYIRKQEDCQEFANDGHVQISEETMVTTGTKHALQCGAFTDAWREWNRVPRANRTWLAWKTHWTRAFEEQRTIQRLTGGEFSANSMTQNDNELANQMVASLDNLALAAVQKNETLEQLIKINEMKEMTLKSLMSQLAAEKETSSKLLAILSKAGLKTGGNNSYGGGSGNASKYDPNGYCWSHGYKVTKNHTSKTCKTRKDGHKEEATRANTMGGSKDNINWKPQA